MPQTPQPAGPVPERPAGGPAGPVPAGGDGAPTRVATRVAALRRRFGALLIDWILCLLIATGFIGPARLYPWAAPAVLVLEYAFFLGFFGRTPGMYLARVRCVGVGDGAPIGVPRAILRGLLLVLVIPAIIMDADRRGLHDRAAGSIVLAVP